jgi:hypothetical protein
MAASFAKVVNGAIQFEETPLASAGDAGAALLKYDPKELHIIFGGLPIHQGIATGTFVTAARMRPTWRHIKGTDGEGIRVRTNDLSARVEVTLRKGTWVNDALSSVIISDEATGLITVPILISDSSGRSLYTSPVSWIERPTDVAYGTDEGVAVWAIICDTWLPFTGGFNRAV